MDNFWIGLINIVLTALCISVILNIFAKRVAQQVVKLTTSYEKRLDTAADLFNRWQDSHERTSEIAIARGKTIHKLQRVIRKKHRKAAYLHNAIAGYNTAKYMDSLKYRDREKWTASLELHRQRFAARKAALEEKQAQIDLEEAIAVEAQEQQLQATG